MLSGMNEPIRVLAGTQQAGGADCLFPVVNELRRRENVEVLLLGLGPAADRFSAERVAFVEPEGGDSSTTDADVLRTVSRFEPDLIITGVLGPTDTGLDYRLLRAAKARHIASLGVLDAWMNYASRFADPATGDRLGYLPNRVAVMDERVVAEMAAEGIPKDRLHVTGHPFTCTVRRHAEDQRGALLARQALGVDNRQCVIVFFSEPIGWAVRQNLNTPVGYDEFAAFALLEEAIAQDPSPSILVVKEHPRRATLTVPDRIGHTKVVPDCPLSVLQMIQAADVVVGMSSTLLVWSYLAGRRVVAIQPGLIAQRDRNMLTRRDILQNHENAGAVARALAGDSRGDPETLRTVRRDSSWADRPEVRVAQCALQMCTEVKAWTC